MNRSHSAAGEQVRARAWVEEVTLPTYRVGLPNRHPMFLDRRVYQGSSGRVYPYAIIDRLSDRAVDETHRVVMLENRYLRVMVMPAFGGRIQYAYDKTNDYAFIYHNHVIKPALVGLAGPWLSGGIEFNWPQHHRPGTFCPVDATLTEDPADGHVTVWLSEIEPMWHLKGTVALTLHPDRAYLEIAIRLANPTPLPQSIHLWTNPAVHVNDDYQSIFPPDVQAVYDHGKRDVSTFPIARGTYYKVDYSRGVDLSWYKNLRVPTSFMAVRSEYDFMGGYDHGRRAGLLHVADHHVVPGKKQWVWGSGEFGRAWDRHLTDADGPYAELMCGVFADNQPDFSWLQPYEEREVHQYFLPYKDIGVVHNATIDAAVSLTIGDGRARIGAYTTAACPDARIRLRHRDSVLFEQSCDLAPEETFIGDVPLAASVAPRDLQLDVMSHDGRVLVAYRPEPAQPEPTPDPATAIPEPARVSTTDALFLAGLHLEQYRHATREPETYYREGLRRDPEDGRCQLALGRLLLRRGQFQAAESHLRAAIRRVTCHNPNPHDGEPHFLLGVCLVYQQREDEAYAAFAKSAWNAAWQDASFFHLARLRARRRELDAALELVDRSRARNQHNPQATHLRALLLRRLGRDREARAVVDAAIDRDPLDFWARNERVLLSRRAGHAAHAEREAAGLRDLLRGEAHTYLEIAAAYAQAGQYDDAIDLLRRGIQASADPPSRAAGHLGATSMPNSRPMLFYMAAWYASLAGRPQEARDFLARAAAEPIDRCFPNSLDALLALQAALRLAPRDAHAALCLGNLWYDKRQVAEATACWQQAIDADPTLAPAHRNIALAYFNAYRDAPRALAALERAFSLEPADARLLFELDLLEKRCGVGMEARLAFLRRFQALVHDREDLLLEYVTLLNAFGEHDEALRLLTTRAFHPWEGGEGRITTQYVVTLVELAKGALAADRPAEAIERLRQARTSPPNLGEGRLAGMPENEVLYWLGVASVAAGERDRARALWTDATVGITEPTPAVYYNDPDPGSIFYQGLACARLGRLDDARARFERLVTYARTHLEDEITIDYFAVSLPELQVFDDDLSRRHEVNCRFLLGLGLWGLGDTTDAIAQLRTVLRLDPSHQAAARHTRLCTGPLAARIAGLDADQTAP